MLHAIRQYHLVTYAISLGLITTYISLLEPIPSASAQQITGTAYQGNSGTGSQGRRIENPDPTLLYPAKSLEKKDTQTLTYKPHRLIRKPQNAPVASVEPSPSSFSSAISLPTPTPSLQNENTISQSKEPSSFIRSVVPTVPLTTMSVAPSSTTTTRSIAAATPSTGKAPLATAGAGHPSASGSGGAGGRSMRRITEDMPGLAQLIAPSSAPAPSTTPPSINPAIGASPTALSFTAQQGGGNPAPQTVTISNTGGPLSWSASENAAWLTLSPASGSGAGALAASVNPVGLATGTYNSTITVAAPGAASQSVTVALTVAAAPAIGASPTALSFTAQQGGANPAAQTVTISNTGGPLSWSASPNTTWLAVSPASGSGNGTITVSATTGILTAGSYNGNITLSATGVSSMTVPVTITVTAAPNISLNPSSLTYAAIQGSANPADQTVSLTNTGGTVNWTVSDSSSWLSVSPASGNSSSTLTAAVNATGLAAGTYNGTITVSATGSSSKTVGVTLTVSAPTTSSATLTWTPNTDADLVGYKIYRATASGAYGAALATVPAGTASYQATGLTGNTTYFFVITAYDTAGNESLFSNEVSKSIF